MRRNPLLVIATMLAVLVSSFLVFTTLSARAIVENNTSRWQNGVHVVIFLDDRVTSTAHKQLQETLESYSEVRMVEYFTKSEAEEEFKVLFRDQPELLKEVDYSILPTSLRINLKQSKGGDFSLRTVVKLPNGSGKKEKIAVLCEQDKISEAKKSGAEIIGSEDLIEKIAAKKIDFSICLFL